MRRFVFTIVIVSVAVIMGCHKEDTQYEDCVSITGAITDFATGESVKNANVQLRPSGETTLTGTDGIYEFKNLPDGDYFITVSKAEYNDLIDNYPISVRKGKTARRDVQIEKKPTYIRITDMGGNDLDCLDFGSDSSITMKSFNVYNPGTVDIHCETVYSCNWISAVSSLPETISPGASEMVSVSIDRSKLVTGINTTELYVRSNNGGDVITIKAVK